MNQLLSVTLLLSLGLLIVLQTNRSIYVRSMGLFLIFACGVLLYAGQAGYYPKLFFLFALMALGFGSDYYSPSLRTWYFRVTYPSQIGLVVGGFIGLLLLSFWFPPGSLLGFFAGSLIGACIGDIRAKGFRTLQALLKVTLGAVAGVFGMSLKLLLGIEMINWLLMDLR